MNIFIAYSGDLKTLTRRFVVLRAEHARGYDATSWASHPHNSDIDENDPWDYLPKIIKDTEPVAVSYEDNAPLSDLFSNAADHPSGLKPPKVSINSTPVSLATVLTSIATCGCLDIHWLRATAQVDISNPGVDIWSVSWAAPVTDHWVSGPGGGGKFKSNYPSLVEFDHNGLKVMKFGAVSGGGGPSHMETYVSYVVGETAGDAWYNYFSLGQLNPSVSMDFQFTYKAGGSETFKQHIPNAVYMYNTDAYLSFPDTYWKNSAEVSGEVIDGVRVAEILPLHMVFRLKDDHYTTTTMEPKLDDDGDIELDEDGEAVMEEITHDHGEIEDARGIDVWADVDGAYYQRKRLSLAGGHRAWSHPIDRSTIDQYSQNSGSSIRPIFSHGKERIWKIALSFVS